MKTLGEWMGELGFREDASETTKRAFLEFLFKSAYPETYRRPQVSNPSENKELVQMELPLTGGEPPRTTSEKLFPGNKAS